MLRVYVFYILFLSDMFPSTDFVFILRLTGIFLFNIFGQVEDVSGFLYQHVQLKHTINSKCGSTLLFINVGHWSRKLDRKQKLALNMHIYIYT